MDIDGRNYCPHCMLLTTEEVCPHCGFCEHTLKENFTALEQGILLNDRYMIGTVIGQGGFGITYSAWDEILGKPVAIKEFFPAAYVTRNVLYSDDVIPVKKHEGIYLDGLLRFRREAQILSSLEEIPNVVNVQDFFSENNTAYIVMEFIHGETLDTWMEHRNLSSDQILHLMRPIVDALVRLHKQGIVHRDLKPGNMLVEEDGSLRLIDFGSATVLDRPLDTVLLTRKYAPIEQYNSEHGKQGPWSDVYGIAAVFYALLTGQEPEDAILRLQEDHLQSPSACGVKIKSRQNLALMSALAVIPDKRTQSMEEFRSRLYNLPLPEEVKRRKRFMIRTVAVAALTSLITLLFILNFTIGFNLGNATYYSLRSDGFHIIQYHGHQENLSIPESRLGIPVVKIESSAFQGTDDLVHLEIPGTVHRIDDFAFHNCEHLLALRLNEGVISIGTQAFANCTILETVSVPKSLNEMAQDAFLGCSDTLVLLGDLDSPAQILSDEAKLMYAHIITDETSEGLTVVRYETYQTDASIPGFIDGKPVIALQSNQEKTPVFPSTIRHIQLPSQLQKIGDYAFYQCKISRIDLPQSLLSIGKEAFSQSYLKQINLPDSVVHVGEGAFSICVNLKEAALSAGMTAIPNGCFEGDIRLETVNIPDGIETVGMLAFSKCDILENLKLPSGLKRIDQYAFSDCISLRVIFIPASASAISYSAFRGCPNDLVISGIRDSFAQNYANTENYTFFDMYASLHSRNPKVGLASDGISMIVYDCIDAEESIELPSFFNASIYKTIMDAKKLKGRHITLPKYTETIDTNAFFNNSYLESVTCPNTLSSIGTYSFAGCNNLRQINLPEGLETINSNAFSACTNLTDIKIPSSVRILNEGSFQYCHGLTEITIPSTVSMIGNGTFAETGIENITIPGSVSKCGTAFYGCSKLKKAEIEDGVRLIQGTFANCRSLETVILPSSMEHISRSTFAGCSSLQDVWIYSDDVDLDYTYPAVYYIEHDYDETGIHVDADGDIQRKRIILESTPLTHLFADCPHVTLHGYEGSSTHVYALVHNIPFEEIPGKLDTSTPVPSYSVSEPIYSNDELIDMIKPYDDQDANYYWAHLNYAYGYAFKDLMDECLEKFEQNGEDYDRIIARSVRLFFEQDVYYSGDFVAFTVSAHPFIQPGDIIVEIDGQLIITDDDRNALSRDSGKSSWKYTILRVDESGCLKQLEYTGTPDDPLFGTRTLTPKTFENNHGK